MKNQSSAYSVKYDQARIKAGEKTLAPLTFDCRKGELLYLDLRDSILSQAIIRSLYGAYPITEGHAMICDREIVNISKKEVAELRKQIAIINDQSYLIDHIRINDNANLFIDIASRHSEPDTRYLEDLYPSLGVQLKMKVRNLSSENQTRLRIALGMLNKPALMLIENVLDPLPFAVRSEIMSALISEARNHGMSIIISTESESLISQFPGRVHGDNEYPKLNLTRSA